ncbi:hypothetical protein B0H13DRAFT_909532 [Mycena leptocephala]|nr:hypothetical protein B0H13DRAFT_909532 [Mycena leptocephala]
MPITMFKRRTPGFVALNNFLVAVLTFSTVYNTPLPPCASAPPPTSAPRSVPNPVAVAIGFFCRMSVHQCTIRCITCKDVASPYDQPRSQTLWTASDTKEEQRRKEDGEECWLAAAYDIALVGIITMAFSSASLLSQA